MARGGCSIMSAAVFSIRNRQRLGSAAFRKMLCDNALLLSTYSRAYRKYRFPLYRKIVEKTVQWLLREMGILQPDSPRLLAGFEWQGRRILSVGKE